MANEKVNWDKVKWTPFQEAEKPELPEWAQKYKKENSIMYLNSVYQVELSLIDMPSPFGKTVYLSFKTRDKQARHDWREIQRIKNELVGDDVEALELYPAESRLVDTANQYHLYCFPFLEFPERRFPFGFHDRLVSEGSDPGGKGSRQRDFRKELKPPDALRGEQLNDISKVAHCISGSCPVDRTPIAALGEFEMTSSDGKTVRLVRAECMAKEKHIFFFTKKSEFDAANGESNDEPCTP